MAYTTKNDFILSLNDLAQAVGLSTVEVQAQLKKQFRNLPNKTFVPAQHVRRYLSQKGFKFPHQVYSFQMLKGGVAKTTSALNFGIRAAMYGAKVLFVDLDQQANLSFALGVEVENKPVWLDIFEKKSTIQQAIISIDEGVDLIPSSLNNSVLDRVLLSSQRNWSQAVNMYLKEVRAHYDIVIIDTAPNLSMINTAVTCASDEVILPINPDKFSLMGVKRHLEDLKDLKSEFDLKFRARILFTKYDARESSSREILSQCIYSFEDILLNHYIRTSSDVKNTIGTTKTIFSTKNNAKEDYDLVTRELLGFI